MTNNQNHLSETILSPAWRDAPKSKSDQCMASLQAMLAIMPGRDEGEMAASAKETLYRMDLEDLPIEDLIKAFSDWRSGRHRRQNGGPWVPTPAEIRELVESRNAKIFANARREQELRREIEENSEREKRLAERTPEQIRMAEEAMRIIRGVVSGDFPLGVPSTNGYTFEHLDDWSLIINGKFGKYTMRSDENGQRLRIPSGYPGAGQFVEYGYLTPAEYNRQKDKIQSFNADEMIDWARETL